MADVTTTTEYSNFEGKLRKVTTVTSIDVKIDDKSLADLQALKAEKVAKVDEAKQAKIDENVFLDKAIQDREQEILPVDEDIKKAQELGIEK